MSMALRSETQLGTEITRMGIILSATSESNVQAVL